MSTVVIKEIEWSNCFSFGDNNKLSLNSSPVVQINAPNGFGKSSIPLILEEALYNKNSKSVKKTDISNRLLNKPYSISVPFQKENDEYRVNISRGTTVKVEFLENGNDISSHTAPETFKHIEQVLGISYKVFQQLVYQSTNSSLEFLVATDTARKKFLIELFDLSEYTKLFDKFKAEITKLDKKLTACNTNIKTYSDWLTKNRVDDTSLIPTIPLPEIVDESEELSRLKISLRDISATNATILSNEKFVKSLKDLTSNPVETPEDNSLKQPSKERIVEIKTIKGDLSNKVKKIKSLDSVCYTCLQPVNKEWNDSELNRIKEESEALDSELKILEEEIRVIEANNVLVRAAKEYNEKVEKLTLSIDTSISNKLLDSTDIEKEISSLQQKVTESKACLNDTISKNNEINKRNSKVETYLEQKDDFDKALSNSKVELENITCKIGKLEVLKIAFGTNGLIAYKLENLVKDLEVYINEYLTVFSDGRFILEFILNGDKLDICLLDNGNPITIQSPSSGELARINISALLGIRKIMADFSSCNINVLFLDEVISVLDDFGKEKLVEILLQERDLNCFLVSHGWYHPLVEKISIEKQNGISRITDG